MSEPAVHQCGYDSCLRDGDHPDKPHHTRMILLLTRLNEKQRRWYVGLESIRLGYGGNRTLCRMTDTNVQTIRPGRRELKASLQ